MLSRSWRPVAALSLALLVVGVAAPAGAQPAAKVTKISFDVTLTSQQTVLHKVGRGGLQTYGWNQLTGTASTPSGDVAVEILGSVDYTSGTGPFFGFMTVKFASLSTLGLRILGGRATLKPDGSTDLKAAMKVIGGDAAMTGATGTGKFVGGRAAELGSPINITVTLRLKGIDS